MKLAKISVLCAVLLVFSANLRAQDAEGCKDSPIITRMPGSTIADCVNNEFEQLELPLGDDKKKTVEGEYHTWSFNTREGVSNLQVFRNFQAALKRAGFTIDYEESPDYITAHKGSTWYGFESASGGYYQRIVVEKAMEQEVVADAAALSNDLNNSGHTAVYGIHFDTGKADVRPESAPALKEIAKVLQENANLKLYLVGHTDNVGSLAANVNLSQRRAEAVFRVLTTQYGVTPGRLQAFGDGPYAPVASNDTDQGRALNRRVELVKQ
jgi:OmpA-OmpF porin, OOP family